ncbi:sulfatase family protein [Membranihabitans maritimus]|uniref:sulfatase family protein n=1 Tax=Membranihabitans maritimus TaxID=2904244 RepID=UPI001F1FA1E5|nr:sulfatase [Membranihabitans maritimus]
MIKIKLFQSILFAIIFAANLMGQERPKPEKRPNILWIISEDQSVHLSCYGEETIKTPNLDKMAKEGVLFENAFVTSPVCSPSRSGFVTGMHPSVLGAHNHRSQRELGDRDGNSKVYSDTYTLPVKSIWELFTDEGYYVCNSGKSDYNWSNQILYNKGTWEKRKRGQPFFAQIQLKGGKDRGSGERLSNPVSSESVNLPPYYPDTPLFREWWADYLDSWLTVDNEVGEIMNRLKRENILDNTIIFFITDHGVSSMRGKQFLYDEGVNVPLIVRFPDKKMAGTVRRDLVLQIDMVATSLKLAGIDVPVNVLAKDLFNKDYQEREFIVTARDRSGDPIDIIRSIRTKKYKYIRNFLSFRPHSQRDQYRDGYSFTKALRKLNLNGDLNELQSRFFEPTRPPEELYDIVNDPFETINLANDPGYKDVLHKNRNRLHSWMIQNGDMGLIPEPILEDLGVKYGNKYFILQQNKNKDLIKQLIDVFEAGELKEISKLENLVQTGNACQKYWAATWLGVHESHKSVRLLEGLSEDKTPAVRIAANLALCKMGLEDIYLSDLVGEINDSNYLVGMYAMNAIEQTGILDETTKKAAGIAIQSKYDNTVRYGRRILSKVGDSQKQYYDEYVPDEYSYLYKGYSQKYEYIDQ